MTEKSTAESIFFAAVDKPTLAERTAYLDSACAGQPELRARVDLLLAAHLRIGLLESEGTIQAADRPDPDLSIAADATGTFSAISSARLALTASAALEGPGTMIAGRYRLIEAIGEGGMGMVYMAQQIEPVKRNVAIKLIKTGMDSKAVLARFEQERQALALMDHPNIARVFDGGMTPNGQPFFVMELVNGQPLNKFCDEMKLTLRERLEVDATWRMKRWKHGRRPPDTD